MEPTQEKKGSYEKPGMDPARDAMIAYAHLMRAEEHRLAGAFGKVERHKRRAKWYARRAIDACDLAFGTDSPARKIARLLGPERAALGLGIPNIGWTCYMGTALQCLFVTTFAVSAKYAALRDSYNDLKAACSEPAQSEDTMTDLATNVYHDVRDAFSAMGGYAGELRQQMALTEKLDKATGTAMLDRNGDVRRLSNKVDIVDFLTSLLACGCDEAECQYGIRHSFDPRIEKTEETDPPLKEGAPLLCIVWGESDEAPPSITVGGANYDLVAMAVDFNGHNTAYAKRRGIWAVYDDVKEVRALGEHDSAKLKFALKYARVYFYQKL